MIVLAWLLIWVYKGSPDLETSPRLNDWLIALIVCVVVQIVFGYSRRN